MSEDRHGISATDAGEHQPRQSVVQRSSIARPGPDVAVDRAEEVAYDPYAERRRIGFKALEAVYLLFSLIEALIAIRFVLRALGANPNAGFAQFIYSASAPLLAPFAGLFASPTIADGVVDGVIELNAIVALLAYALLAWLVGKLVWLIIGETRSAVKAIVSSTETHLAH